MVIFLRLVKLEFKDKRLIGRDGFGQLLVLVFQIRRFVFSFSQLASALLFFRIVINGERRTMMLVLYLLERSLFGAETIIHCILKNPQITVD
jgi:hypothetical protein